jgi:hypothetical protein
MEPKKSSEKQRLFLFDCDDTLIIADVQFTLTKGTDTKVVSTEGYKDLKNSGELEGWTLDLKPFQDPVVMKETITTAKEGPGLDLLQEWLHAFPDADFGILTNRSGDEKVFISALQQFMDEHDIDWIIDPTFVFCTNHPKYGLSTNMNNSEQKLYFIKEILDDDLYDEIILVDDDLLHKKTIDLYTAKHGIDQVKVIDVNA